MSSQDLPADRMPTRAPSLYLIDIQPQQRADLETILAETQGSRLVQLVPSLRARVARIAGRPVADVRVAEDVAWTVSRDRGLTYAATLPEGSALVAGAWWPEDYAGPALVSIDEEIARGYGVGLGDTLTFIDSNQEPFANGRIVNIVGESLHVQFVPGATGRAPVKGDMAVAVVKN